MSSASRDSVGHPSDTLNSPEEGYRDVRYLSGHPRQNYLIVFEEIGEPVHELHQFTRVFTAIQGAWEGLHAIHLDECVHRDVSSGNVLLVPASELKGLNERGVIMDLEYGKKINDTKAPHDVRTGTAAFMATEVAFMEHHRLTELRATDPGVSSVEALELEAKQEMEQIVNYPSDVPSLVPSLPPFRHNPLHDTESISWLCIWMMFYLAPSGVNGTEQLNSYREAFGNRQAKRSFFCTPGVFEKHTSQLRKLRELQPLVAQMRSWVKALNRLYKLSYEKQNNLGASLTMIQIDPEIINVSYTLGQGFLQCLLDASKKITTEFVPLALVPKDNLTQTTSRGNAENSRESNKQKQGSPFVMPPPTSRHSKKRRDVTFVLALLEVVVVLIIPK
ncbi:unnamed protein product [Rhizoctonia solani]|uniref:Fungal-type protein kinase domain-containing protein n=1 Tax=Rhizoctonia solani TaxID=456999 RepID=A0A8H3H2V5_9AGAM|nr:unnamed protein product [Rhizoctonia solani]